MTDNNNNDDLSPGFRGSARSPTQYPTHIVLAHDRWEQQGEFDNNEWEEKNRTSKNKNTKEFFSFLIDVEIIKGIPTQIASLPQRDEVKKVEMTVLTLWNGIQFHNPKVQTTYVAFVWWQELTKPAYLLLQVSNQ